MSTQQVTTARPTLLTQDEVAEILHTPARTVENWRYRGGGPKFVKFGRRVLYRLEAVEKFIEAHEQNDQGDQ